MLRSAPFHFWLKIILILGPTQPSAGDHTLHEPLCAVFPLTTLDFTMHSLFVLWISWHSFPLTTTNTVHCWQGCIWKSFSQLKCNSRVHPAEQVLSKLRLQEVQMVFRLGKSVCSQARARPCMLGPCPAMCSCQWGLRWWAAVDKVKVPIARILTWTQTTWWSKWAASTA